MVAFTKCLLLAVVAAALVVDAVASTNTKLFRRRVGINQDPSQGQKQKSKQGQKNKQPVPPLDLSGVQRQEGPNAHRPPKIPTLDFRKLGLPVDDSVIGPRDFMPEMATESLEKYNEYLADFNTKVKAFETKGFPLVANNFPDLVVPGTNLKINMVFYSGAKIAPDDFDLVPYDQAFAQAAMNYIKIKFTSNTPDAPYKKVVPEVFQKLKSLKVLAAPIEISSIATVFPSQGQGSRTSEYEAVIFIGRLAWKKINECAPTLRGALVADSYTVATKDQTARPYAFFLHEFAHVVMMTTQTEQYHNMVKICEQQIAFTDKYDQMATTTLSFLQSIKATATEQLTSASPYYGNHYNFKVLADVSTYAQAKPGVCGYLEFIPELWSAAMLGMPPTQGEWAETFFKLLVPGMPLHRAPVLQTWCRAFEIRLVLPAPLKAPKKINLN